MHQPHTGNGDQPHTGPRPGLYARRRAGLPAMPAVATMTALATMSGGLAALLAGCASEPTPSITLAPSDFADPPVSRAQPQRVVPPPRATEGTASDHSDAGDDPDAPTPPDAAPSPVARAQITSALVGQVNGNPIYAREVLEPMDAQLAALARQHPPREFMQLTQRQIAQRLEQLIIDALILGEARRTLSQRDRTIIDYITQKQREELIRKYGQGSMTVADDTLEQTTGKGLDQTLEDFRQRQIVTRFMQVRVMSQINVTRRDIERYYHDHPELFNPPPVRTVRVIRVASSEELAEVERALEAGEPFAEVAGRETNLFRRDEGGLWGEVKGEPPFADARVNEAVLSLEAGAVSEPIEVDGAWWVVHVERIVDPPKVSLVEAQPRIERALKEARFQAASNRLRREFFQTGSYTPVNQMGTTLMRIAAARYLTATGGGVGGGPDGAAG